MRRRLHIAGITAVLLLSGWGGALAAVCPHVGSAGGGQAGALHDCCRKGDGEAASCPMRMNGSGGHHEESADAHGASHTSQGHRPAAVERAEGGGKVGSLVARVDPCTHCTGGTAPPAPAKVRAPEGSKRGADLEAPRAVNAPAPHTVLFVRKVIPSQGAPPGAAPLHVLNNVFLI